jgi:hypothetical protein
MAAPEYVPQPKADQPRSYESPPWSGDGWIADRPGDLDGPQPVGPRLGYPGPDQGYALKLANQLFRGRLVLTPGEDEDDVIAGAVVVAQKRASVFGRAPVVHDLTVAFTIWGYLAEAAPELVRLRRKYFRAVAVRQHYMERRRIADVVPVAVLELTPRQVGKAAGEDPRRERMFRRRAPAPAPAPVPAQGVETTAPAS